MNVAVRVSVAAVGMVLALLAGPAAVRAGNVPCEQVIAKSNELARKGSEKKGDVIYIGRRLGTSPLWVERCFQAHGRRVTRHAQRGSEEPEDLLERWEEAEREEPAREEDQGYVRPQPTEVPRNYKPLPRPEDQKRPPWRDSDKWRDSGQ